MPRLKFWLGFCTYILVASGGCAKLDCPAGWCGAAQFSEFDPMCRRMAALVVMHFRYVLTFRMGNVSIELLTPIFSMLACLMAVSLNMKLTHPTVFK